MFSAQPTMYVFLLWGGSPMHLLLLLLQPRCQILLPIVVHQSKCLPTSDLGHHSLKWMQWREHIMETAKLRLTSLFERLQQNIVFHYRHFVSQTLELNIFSLPLGLQERTVVVKGHLHLTTPELWSPRGDHNSGTHAVLMRKIHTNVEWDKTTGWHFIPRDQRSASLHCPNFRPKPISGHKSARMKGKRKWVCFTGDWKLSLFISVLKSTFYWTKWA